MLRLVVAITVIVTMAGCSNRDMSSPMALGVFLDDAEAKPAAIPGETPPAIKNVKSGRVLGAMAFEKVTGMSVEPSRLAD